MSVDSDSSISAGSETRAEDSRDVQRWLVLSGRLNQPRTQRLFTSVAISLTALCLVAALVRLSFFPLIPLPLFVFGWFSTRKMIGNLEKYRPLLYWSAAFTVAVLV